MSSKSKKNAGFVIGSTAKIVIFSIISVIVVGLLVLIVLEGVNKEKITIVNNTNKNITSLKVLFETEDESEELQTLYDGELKSGASYSGSYTPMDFSEAEADLGMLVTFEGESEIYVYDGYFYDRFNGNIDIDFHQAKGEYRATLSATNGLFRNSDNSAMKDDEIYFDFEAADWDIVDD